ncbi:MAG: hypothetical protein K8I60_04835, partial [Anaerolineae bacterium]|nr:hypothetical protein [Anaerolineae bacterium]
MSANVALKDVTKLVDAIRDAIRAQHPTLESGEAFSFAQSGLALVCPRCGQYNDQVISMLYIAGSGMFGNAVFGGPNVAALAKGQCPSCGGENIVAVYSPDKLKAHLATAATNAVNPGLPEIKSTGASLPFLSSLTVSPDESVMAMIVPGEGSAGQLTVYETGTERQGWSVPIQDAKSASCRFIASNRLILVAKSGDKQSSVRLLNALDGATLHEISIESTPGSSISANAEKGIVVMGTTFNIFTFQLAQDQLEVTELKSGQIYAGPKLGPDAKPYVIISSDLSRVENGRLNAVMKGSNCITFQGASSVYCGGGYSDRSGTSALHIGDTVTGESFEIPWGNEPIDQIEPAGADHVLTANRVTETNMGRYPNATVTMVSTQGRKKLWTTEITDIKPYRRPILISVPEEGWAILETGHWLKRISVKDGKATHVIQKSPSDYSEAVWLPSKRLLYVAHTPDRNKPGTLEGYT